MKTIRNIFTACLVVLTAISCEDLRFGNDFLEMPPGNNEDLSHVFETEENADQVLAAAYKTLPDGLIQEWDYDKHLCVGLLESLTDVNNTSRGWGAVEEFYYAGQLDASSESFNHKYNYDKAYTWFGIRYAWLYVENADQIQDITEERRAMKKAEAKTIVAIHYCEMFRHFGGVPLIERTYGPNDDFTMPRATAQETVDFIIRLLDESIPYLPWTVSSKDDGHITAAAAMALKVRVLLFAASPLLNDDQPYMDGEASDGHYCWFGAKDEGRWQDVIKAGEEFMDALEQNGYYKMVCTGNPREDFRNGYSTRGNTEVLLSTRYYDTWKNNSNMLKQTLFGACNPTLDYVEMFPFTTGEEFDWNNSDHAMNPFWDASGNPRRDPRLYETVVIPGDIYSGIQLAESWIGGRLRHSARHDKSDYASGFCLRKFVQDRKSIIGQFYSYPYLRLPEVFLSLAEAYNETDQQDKAYEMVKLVRDRVELPNFPSGLTKEEFREKLLTERALEFGYEQFRFFDLIRWKRDDIFRKKLRGLDTWKKGKNIYTYEIYELPNKRAWQGDHWDPKLYFGAFPVNEVNKDYGLVQNPGW